ncbi:uncharacterized protein LOC129797102 [Lutzomyia longipalpis]|uniref:Uncharacterized protein n=1 Tax=Lutzomyia longipalpis TaxID=7200 RepID=A0A1B0CJM5_LUTLO|nr:uncharacterized protein LOC129797102 [Lutzomyia longipalpis]XP_055695403.1 uncharacterized protein LOC129797102 [Lutzomyia longipalpis]
MDNQESISSARSLPQWMRTRMDNRIDATDIPFSPPTHDESFFYVRYPAAEKKRQGELSQQLKTALEDAGGMSSVTRTQDFSKHTDQCKMFLDGANQSAKSMGTQLRPHGTDDGFKGAGAACGSSIVRMAQTMVKTRPFTRGFTVANFEEASPDADFPAINPEEDFAIANSIQNKMRRGSKSLPASPMGSPKTARKMNQNPYFTTNQTTLMIGDQKKWNLSDFLGLQRKTALSTQSVVSQIDENAEEALEMDSKFTNLDQDRLDGNNQGKNTEPPTVLKAKPSELREMNFWSPTSM